MLNPNCSEAVFRFYTLDPELMQKILQIIANEVGSVENEDIEIPLFAEPSEYESIEMPGDFILTVENRSFRVNIQNDYLTNNNTNWVENILSLGVEVEEAETSDELSEYARDCTCGIVFFPRRSETTRKQKEGKINEYKKISGKNISGY